MRELTGVLLIDLENEGPHKSFDRDCNVLRRLEALELNLNHILFFRPPNQRFEISQRWLCLDEEE